MIRPKQNTIHSLQVSEQNHPFTVPMVLTTNTIIYRVFCTGHPSGTGVVMASSAVILENALPQAAVWYIDGQSYSNVTDITVMWLEFATYDL